MNYSLAPRRAIQQCLVRNYRLKAKHRTFIRARIKKLRPSQPLNPVEQKQLRSMGRTNGLTPSYRGIMAMKRIFTFVAPQRRGKKRSE